MRIIVIITTSFDYYTGVSSYFQPGGPELVGLDLPCGVTAKTNFGLGVARKKRWRPLLLFLFGSVCSTVSAAVEITDLGTLGGEYSIAYAINDSDQIIGGSWTTGNEDSHVFLYSNGQMTDLWPFLYAENLNNAGQIAGAALSNGISYPAMYDSRTGTTTTLGSLGGVTSDGFAGLALGINTLGQVVGYSYLPSGPWPHAFLYDNGVMHDLGCLPGARNRADLTVASDINDHGKIVGGGQPVSGSRNYAFLHENGVMTDVTPFGSSWSSASAVNNHGQVVGHYWTRRGSLIHSFLYSKGKFMEIGVGTSDTEASDINDRGQVVGMTMVPPASCRTCDEYAPHAFLYQNGVLTDLNNLLPPGSGWELEWAYAINNKGNIVGQGVINGQTHAFLIKP